MGALLVAAASLLANGAYAQNNNAAPPAKANAADKADKAGDKAEKKAEKAADKAEDKAKSAERAGDRAARKQKEHDAQRDKLKAMLKGPMDDGMKQELRRHAERLAKLERIKAVATTEKDTATVDKATSLIAKENVRHDKWMEKKAANPAGANTAAPTNVPVTNTAAAPAKEGAK